MHKIIYIVLLSELSVILTLIPTVCRIVLADQNLKWAFLTQHNVIMCRTIKWIANAKKLSKLVIRYSYRGVCGAVFCNFKQII